MGFFSSSSKKTTNVDKGPWKVQAPYVEKGFKEAESLYDANKGKTYDGEFIAGLTPQQKDILNTNIANAGTLSDTGLDWMKTGTDLMGKGTAGVNKAASGLYDMANMDMVQRNIDSANRYVSGYDFDAMTKAGMAAANRNASENLIPNLYRSNAVSGNMNSDRAALAQGVVERGLAENTQNLYTKLASEAFKSGLDLSQNDLKLMASNLANSGDLYGSMADYGLNLGKTGADLSSNADRLGYQFASEFRNDNQASLDNALKKFEYNDDRKWNNLAKYYAITGANNWGEQSTTTEKSKSTPSGMQIAASAINTLGSLFGG